MSEGQIYENASIPPLTQTLAELEHELTQTIALKATLGTRMVGTARARLEDGTLHIGRIAVAPDMQGRGIGSALIERLETEHGAGAHTFALFTGRLEPGEPAALRAARLPRDARRAARLRRPPRAPREAGARGSNHPSE